jgi:hypothetical protein
MIVKNGEKMELVNAPKQIPLISGKNLIEYLIEARKVGIYTWDDNIEQELNSLDIDKFIKQFLKNPPEIMTTLGLEINDINPLPIILKYLTPILFIIPSGIEEQKLTSSLTWLKEAGIENHEISTLFRLPSNTGARFNKYIQENKLNSPISEITKAVFISGKIPKTIFESKIAFNLIVNHSIYNVHYTIRDFVKWHHNVIIVDSNRSIV